MLTKNKYANTPLPSIVAAQLVEKLKQLRKKEKYSQKELAERSGVSLGSIKRFETTGKISLESLLSIAHVLHRLDDFEDVFKYDERIDIVKGKFDL